MPVLIFLMLQLTPQQVDDSVQSGFIFGYVVGGLVLTRIVSWVLRFVLVKTLLRGLYVVSALIAAVVTFALCAIGLWVRLSMPRENFTVMRNTYGHSTEYPTEMLLIYGVCIVIWLVVDLFLARRAERRFLEREAEANQTSQTNQA